MDTGISKAFSVISNKLREKCGVNVELYRLYKAAEAGAIKMKGHGLNFSKIRDQVYSQLAGTIANDIDRLWAEDWDIDTIILTGGGCMDLAQYLQPLIAGNVRPIMNSVDARLNNVQGYIKYAKYIWGESAPESPPAPTIEEEALEDALIEEHTPEDALDEEHLPEDGLVETQTAEDALVDDDTLEEIEELVEERLPDE
jgi:plasmid segregation protein ParM